MDAGLQLLRWRRAAEQNSAGTMLRFTDFASPEFVEKDMDFEQRLNAIVEMEAKGDVYLGFENVEYLCAADIGRVVRVWKKLKDENRRLVLCHVRPLVWELFHITRVDELMEIDRSGPHLPPSASV
jgi:anti-anti-sigma factor